METDKGIFTYPECEKMSAVRELSQACGEFLEFLQQKGFLLAQYGHWDSCKAYPESQDEELNEDLCNCGRQPLVPVYQSTEKLLADFFEIDLNKIEQEKRQMLEQQRKLNQ